MQPFCTIARPVFRISQCWLLPLILLLGFGFCVSSTQAVTIEVPANASCSDIQNALDHLPAAGGEVHLVAGTYMISEPLNLKRDHQTLRGSGTNTVLRLANGANCPVVILGAPMDPSRSAAHVRLADVFIDGNRQQQKAELWKSAPDGALINNNGVNVWDVKDALVENVICCRCRSGGLVTAHGTRRLTIRNFTSFDNHFDGLACYQTEDSTFTGLDLHDNPGAGISLDLSFNHNVISNAVMTGNDLGIFMRDSRDNTFQSLIIRQSHNHGVFMAQAGGETPKGWQLVPGTQCTGNKFAGLVIVASGGKAFLVNNETCINNVITAAKFQDDLQGGLVEPVLNLVSFQKAP